jgi:hypothetical protein
MKLFKKRTNEFKRVVLLDYIYYKTRRVGIFFKKKKYRVVISIDNNSRYKNKVGKKRGYIILSIRVKDDHEVQL